MLRFYSRINLLRDVVFSEQIILRSASGLPIPGPFKCVPCKFRGEMDYTLALLFPQSLHEIENTE